jgi:hypothetical protein
MKVAKDLHPLGAPQTGIGRKLHAPDNAAARNERLELPQLQQIFTFLQFKIKIADSSSSVNTLFIICR